MKTLLSFIAFVFSANAIAGVPGSIGSKVVSTIEGRSFLTVLDLDPKLDIEDPAYAMIDAQDNQLTLTILVDTCPEGVVCVVGPVPVLTVTLPIVSVSDDGCGSRVFTAMIDKRPVDGMFRQLTLTDHTTRLCEDLQPHMTEVVYETATPGFGSPVVTTESHFAGRAVR